MLEILREMLLQTQSNSRIAPGSKHPFRLMLSSILTVDNSSLFNKTTEYSPSLGIVRVLVEPRLYLAITM